ncbi:MAG: hypothetical protein ACRC5C_03025, partial [Bacilli bacterium]
MKKNIVAQALVLSIVVQSAFFGLPQSFAQGNSDAGPTTEITTPTNEQSQSNNKTTDITPSIQPETATSQQTFGLVGTPIFEAFKDTTLSFGPIQDEITEVKFFYRPNSTFAFREVVAEKQPQTYDVKLAGNALYHTQFEWYVIAKKGTETLTIGR